MGSYLRIVAPLCLLAAGVASAEPVREGVVTFRTHDGLEIQGVLSLPPAGAGPFPGVLLIHGSGLHDADHEIDEPTLGVTDGPQEHFKKLARFLGRKGVAVLRYNKRGASFEHQSDNPQLLSLSTLDDLVEDARAALATLYADPRVDASRLAVWGWSEGSVIAPRLAREQPEVAVVVLVGPVARSLVAVTRYQLVERYLDFYRVAADGNGDGAVTLAELARLDDDHGLSSFYVWALAPALFGLTRAELDAGVEITSFAAVLDANADGRLQIDDELLPLLEADLTEVLAAWRAGSPYTRSLLGAEPPVRRIHRVTAELLIVQGEADNQTPAAESRALVAKLERRGRSNWELLSFPGLGHSLSPMNDLVRGDGGLTVLDNPTLNVMKRRTMRSIWRSLRGKL